MFIYILLIYDTYMTVNTISDYIYCIYTVNFSNVNDDIYNIHIYIQRARAPSA